MRVGARGRKNFFCAQSWLCGARARRPKFFKISRGILRFRSEGFVALCWEELLAPRAERGVALGGLLRRAEKFVMVRGEFSRFLPAYAFACANAKFGGFPCGADILKNSLCKNCAIIPLRIFTAGALFLPLSAERRAFRRGFKASEGAPAPARKAGYLAAFRGACARPKFS